MAPSWGRLPNMAPSWGRLPIMAGVPFDNSKGLERRRSFSGGGGAKPPPTARLGGGLPAIYLDGVSWVAALKFHTVEHHIGLFPSAKHAAEGEPCSAAYVPY
eukprot:5496856-Prymnesium_polylepis.1